MSEPLYQRCTVCKGSTWLNNDNSPAVNPTADVPQAQKIAHDMMAQGKFVLRACPCQKSKTPGWFEIGLTTGQVERMVDLERTLQGDEGIPQAKRAAILAHVRARLGLLSDRGYFKKGKGDRDETGAEGLGAGLDRPAPTG